MKIYRYWERASAQVPGEDWGVVCFGGSDISPEDARRAAGNRATRVAGRLGGRFGEQAKDDYSYADRPLREELKEEIASDGNRQAVLTRNACGALILNTCRVMFLDIDFARPGFLERLKRLVGRGRDAERDGVGRVRQQVAAESGLGLRLYRTAGGLRGIVTSALYDPTSPNALGLLERFGCDPLYIRLCRAQECFRARLTPKHWRCGLPVPPARFPYQSDAERTACRNWEADYAAKTASVGVCRFLESFGVTRMEPEAEQIVRLHDRLACIPSALLA